MARYITYGDQKIDIDQTLYELDLVDAEESLASFVKQAWHIIEPGQKYVHGWHIDFICAHLEAITDGVELDNGELYNRLLINVPPGLMKSLLCGVFFPAWEWGPRNMPHLRYVCASHSLDLAIRDGLRMRRLITSDWYQKRWGDRVTLTGDQNQKTKFENTSTGFRQAAAAGSITGARGDRVIIDDPHSVDGANSDAQRERTVQWFLEAVPTRLNNPDSSAIIVIMQRLHEADVSGVILDKRLGYDHVMLPMMLDKSRAYPTKLGIEDPRETEGELLFPARFPQDVVDRDSKVMGPYATAGQFQQEPTPRGGGVIKAQWWETWMDEGGYPPMDYIIASIDTAYTSKTENDPSAMTVWGVFSGDIASMRADNYVNSRGKMRNNVEEAARFDEGVRIRDMLDHNPESVPKVMLMGAWQEHLELSKLVEKVAATCRKFKVDKLLVEAKASGLSVAQEIRRLYGAEDFAVQLINPGSLDKLARVYSIQHLFSEGMIFAPDRQWADMVIRQCEVFPKGKHDDLCLVGDTNITMADGTSRPLSELSAGEMVATPAGPRQIVAAGMTGVEPVWRLEFNGGFLEGTSNHPIFVDGEWKQLASLCPYDILTLYQQDKGASWLSRAKMALSSKQWSSMAVNTIVTQTQKTLRTAAILRAQVTGFIETYGNFITDQSLKVIKSTMLMATPATTTLQTLSAWSSKPIAPNTMKTTLIAGDQKNSLLICQRFKSWQRSGTKVMLAENGIGKTHITPSEKKGRQSLIAKAITRAFVIGADLLLRLKALKRSLVHRLASLQNPNTCAVKDVYLTHTMRPVYNLTVEGEHCYFANGVLTHNCDTVSMALRHLRETGLLVRAPERMAEIDAGRRHVGAAPAPLYPI